MRKVLVVAYIFPPTATTGVHRTTKFAKYLPEFGWQPIVLTTGNSAYERIDRSLTAELSDELKVIRVKAFESAQACRLARGALRSLGLESRFGAAIDWRIESIFRGRSIPDEHAPWARKAIPVALEAVRQHDVDVIFTTSWPYSDHLVGMEVARQTGLPWVADFRDPWLANSNYHRDSEDALGCIEKKLEKNFVESASAIIGTSKHMVESFRKLYPGFSSQHFRLVRNGYDPENIPKTILEVTPGPMKIGYVGAFYRTRSPKSILAALAALREQGVSPKEIQLAFVGNMGGTESYIQEYDLEQYCRVYGQLSFSDCYRAVADCHILWHLNPSEDAATIPGKTYEYLASGKWILASMPCTSESAQLLAAAGEGATFVEPDDVDEMTAALRDLLARHEAGVLTCCRNAEYVEQFSRQRQAGLLADILNEVSEASTV